MIKNQLYPYIEQYINSYLYGFTKEQLDVGIMKGEIKLEGLNLRPDGVNEVLDKTNNPFWLKAGLISKISAFVFSAIISARIQVFPFSMYPTPVFSSALEK